MGCPFFPGRRSARVRINFYGGIWAHSRRVLKRGAKFSTHPG
jgi:hypothetical protein